MSPARATSEKSHRRSASRRKAALVAEYIRELSGGAGGGSARRPRPRAPQGELAG
jgi:hypothetical protein